MARAIQSSERSAQAAYRDAAAKSRPALGGLTLVPGADYGSSMVFEPADEVESPPLELHDHAFENLRFIRRTMETAGSFTAVSGIGQILIGITALIAAWIASRHRVPAHWLEVWLIEAGLAVLIGFWFIRRKARATGLSLTSAISRKFLICFSPPLVAGAILTGVLAGSGQMRLLPGVWLLLFGAAVVTGGAMSVRIVPLMGMAFMALGAAALLAPAQLGDLFLAAGFGGLLMGFGAAIAWRYGG